ncbi:MAG TPA: RodZ domain-containing protein [Terriglobales bacterium]|nr:RodZ domain-containing protein [Terriglobales bacterium]
MAPFGAQLKKIREQRSITLDQISISTKIGVRFLQALEEERFEQLPGGIFNKAFVRSYARTIGVDENQAVADYLIASGEDQPKKPTETREENFPLSVAAVKKESIRKFPWRSFAIFLLVVVVVLSLGFWAFHPRQLNVSERSALSISKAATGASLVVASEHPQPAITGNRELSTNGQQSTQSIPTPGAFTVKIRATDDSWLSITADGKEIMQDTLAAEEEKTIAAQKQIVIKSGNIGGVDIWFNGNKLPSQGEYGYVRTLTFGANGLLPAEHKKTAALE